MLAAVALTMIGGYQRWLSPRKGYACAYRLAHGGTGCSGFAKMAIAELGVVAALPAIRERFRRCKMAAANLRSANSKRRKARRERWYDNWNPADCGCGDTFCGRSRGAVDPTPDGCDCAPDCCSP